MNCAPQTVVSNTLVQKVWGQLIPVHLCVTKKKKQNRTPIYGQGVQYLVKPSNVFASVPSQMTEISTVLKHQLKQLMLCHYITEILLNVTLRLAK